MGVRHTETSIIIWSAGGTNQAAVEQGATTTTPVLKAKPLFKADRWYDAGSKGCAAGPLDEIAGVLQKMESGQTLEIHATDPTVAVDLAAWCRMTGHVMVDQQESHYLVKHK